MSSVEGAVAAGLSTSIAQLVEKAFQGAVSSSREGANILATKMVIGFERYIATTRSRCENVKTLLSSSIPARLSKEYEPVDLRIGDFVISIDQLISDLGVKRNHALITATLGSGKSFTMRYIFNQFSNPGVLSYLPVFIELRNVPFSEKSLVSYIFDVLSPFTNFVSEKSIISGLKSGVFCLILDGFDEIPGKHRRAADSQINRIVSEYPNNIVIVSSRPDQNRFVSWHAFPEYSVEKLSQEKLESLIDRITFDRNDKDVFLNRIRSGLFDTRGQLLSNPLLASMMLLTFKEFQDVPSKMHVFYGIAFDVLYRRHDTTKGDYQREFSAGLDLNDFRRFFMTFCFMSFLDRKFDFNSSSFESYAKRALAYEEMENAAPDSIYTDLNSNICIINTEGSEINFMHRSFQEYFAALFLSKRSVEQSADFIDFLLSESNTEDFFSMLIEIDKEEFERKYLIAKLESVDQALSSAKRIKEKVLALADSYLISLFGDGPNIFMPIGGRIRPGSKDPINNTVPLINTISSYYDIDIYNNWEDAIDGWESNVPESLCKKDTIALVSYEKLPVRLIEKTGLKRYLSELTKKVKALRKDLEARHNKKTKLLSDVLRRASHPKV